MCKAITSQRLKLFCASNPTFRFGQQAKHKMPDVVYAACYNHAKRQAESLHAIVCKLRQSGTWFLFGTTYLWVQDHAI